MMPDDQVPASEDPSAPKKRRVPAPRKKSVSEDGSTGSRVPARRAAGGSSETGSEDTQVAATPDAGVEQPAAAHTSEAHTSEAQKPEAQKSEAQVAAEQQAAAQRAAQQAAQQAAAQQAAQQAAAQQAAAQKAAQQAAAQKAAQQAAAQKAAQQAAQQAAAQKAAAQKAAQQAAQQAAAQKAAAQKAAAQQQTAAPQQGAQQAAAQQQAAKKAAALKAAQQAAAGGQAVGASAAATVPGSVSKKPHRPLAPTRKSRLKQTGVAGGPPPRGDGVAGAESKAESRKKFFIIGGSAVGVLVVVGLLAILMGGDPPPVPVEPSVDKEPVVDLKELREKEARLALERVEKSNAEDPTDWIGGANRLGGILNEYANTEAAREAGDLRQQLLNDWKTFAEQSWVSIKGDVRAAFASGEFDKAASILEKLPKVFEGADAVLTGAFVNDLDNLRKDAKEQLRYKKRLDELSNRAGNYARMGFEDIAIAIIDALPEKVEDEAPDVWRIKEELVKTIQREGLAMLLNREEAMEEELAEARRLEAERKKEERERRWRDLRDSVPWVSLLARSNLYNWVTSSDRQLLSRGQSALWRVVERDGLGVLVGDNRSGNDIYTGVFSNHWEDFVCQFEVSLKTGALRISPRSRSNPGTGALAEQTSPMLELGDDFPKNRWVKVTIEVHGESVVLRYGDAGTEMILDSETTRIPATGGLVFWIADGTRVELRDVRVKLVSDSRDGGIFAK